MASDLIVPIVTLENVRPHSAAEKLDLTDVLGYQMCVPKGKHKTGDIAIYIPADSILPREWAEKWGVLSYLKGGDQNRVGRVKLRGEPSFGLIVDMSWLPQGDYKVGDNVAQLFNITKYIPPMKSTAGDAAPYNERIDPFIEKYTDIQNWRIFQDVFVDGEEVIITEKVDGSNAKFGAIEGTIEFAGSMSYRRTRPVDKDGKPCEFNDPLMLSNNYWYPWTLEPVQRLIRDFSSKAKIVTMYGEVYGNVQGLNYGVPKGRGVRFAAFDLKLDGKYMDADEFLSVCEKYGIPTVSVLYRGPYSKAKVKELAEGKTTFPNADHLREGCVVKSAKERIDPKIGRAALKAIGTEYELKYKDRGQDTTDA